jgi:hypothetical protein
MKGVTAMLNKAPILVVAAISGLCVSSAYAAEREFVGFAQIISGVNCPRGIGRDLVVRFLPANVADNGNTTDLALFSQSLAQGYHLNAGFYTNAFKPGTMTHIGSRFGDGVDNPVQMRKVGTTPNPDNLTVNYVVTIDIKGYDFQPACVARLRLMVTRDVPD